MGQRKYPPLTPNEVVAILQRSEFLLKRTTGDHSHFERGPVPKDPTRRIVTVDMGVREFDDTLVKSMIQQSGMSRNDFYGATKRTAAKAQVPFVRVSPELEGD